MSEHPAQEHFNRCMSGIDPFAKDRERIERELGSPLPAVGYSLDKGTFRDATFIGNWSQNAGLGRTFADSYGRIWREDRDHLTMIFDPRA